MKVDCRQPATPKVEPVPASSVQEWVEKGPLWAVSVLDTLTLERKYRKLEQNCHQESQK